MMTILLTLKKRSLIVFAVALALPLGLLLLSYFGYIIQISYPSSSSSFDQAFSLLYYLVSIFGSFALFYFLGKTTEIKVVKSIILALSFGFLVGSLISSLFITSFSVSSLVAYLENKILGIIDVVFRLFFPALAGLLFVELRAKEPNNALTA
jgi:hypothetical protein